MQLADPPPSPRPTEPVAAPSRRVVQQLAAPGQLDEERCMGVVAVVHAAVSYCVSRRWGTCTKRRGACTAHVLPSLSQPHPRGTRWSSFLYEKGSPRGNLTRVLVVHLVEGGSSTTGEQTNCDLTRYVKKEANHVGPTLEARLYTLEYF